MINFNGHITDRTDQVLPINNRGFAYGDAVFETMKAVGEKVLFLEDHYFRLMASMRILRMEIPMAFTMEFMESEIVELLKANGVSDGASRIRFMVNRKSGGYYSPATQDIDYAILVASLPQAEYQLSTTDYTVDLYKDHLIAPGLLSGIKTNNRVLNVLGSIYARENDFNNSLILNTDKAVVEALNANVFLVKGTVVKTPPLSDGCIKGIMRKQVISLVESLGDYTLEESSISPFELVTADELFLTNIIVGLQPVTQYRKNSMGDQLTQQLIGALNNMV